MHTYLLDVLADANHGERKVGRGETLGARYDVGNHAIVVLKAPHATRAAKAHHDLVAYHQFLTKKT